MSPPAVSEPDRRSRATVRATSSELADAQLAVSELFTNAVEHGDGGRVTVTVDLSSSRFWGLAVTSHLADPSRLPALLRHPEQWTRVDPSARSGRGLGIVQTLLEGLRVDIDGSQLMVSGRIARSAPAHRPHGHRTAMPRA